MENNNNKKYDIREIDGDFYHPYYTCDSLEIVRETIAEELKTEKPRFTKNTIEVVKRDLQWNELSDSDMDEYASNCVDEEGEVEVAHGITYPRSQVRKEMDPIGWRCLLNDMEDIYNEYVIQESKIITDLNEEEE